MWRSSGWLRDCSGQRPAARRRRNQTGSRHPRESASRPSSSVSPIGGRLRHGNRSPPRRYGSGDAASRPRPPSRNHHMNGPDRNFLAVAGSSISWLQCSWPVRRTAVGRAARLTPSWSIQEGWRPSAIPSTPCYTARDSVVNPPPPDPRRVHAGRYVLDGTFIAWEPENMAEVVRLVADVGSNSVEANVPDVMTGLPTDTSAGGPPTLPPTPGDSGVGGGGNGGGGFPGSSESIWCGMCGAGSPPRASETNSLDGSGGACTSDRTTFDWAEFSCEAARFRFEFRMRSSRLEDRGAASADRRNRRHPTRGDHVLAMPARVWTGPARVVAWTPPPPPVPARSHPISTRARPVPPVSSSENHGMHRPDRLTRQSEVEVSERHRASPSPPPGAAARPRHFRSAEVESIPTAAPRPGRSTMACECQRVPPKLPSVSKRPPTLS